MKMNWIKYIDCMDSDEGLPSLLNNSIDLCLTDPPYNTNDFGVRGYKFRNWSMKKNRKERKIYSDFIEDYLGFCKSWFNEIKRITKIQLIYCGLNNIGFWYRNFEVKDLLIQYKPFSAFGSKIAIFSQYAPIICFGDFDQNLTHNVVKDNRTKYKDKWIHPHPKSVDTFKIIISQMKVNSVIDPFIGSGTTAEACLKLGIPYCGYERKIAYKVDIDKRIKRGLEYIPPKKFKIQALEDFI